MRAAVLTLLLACCCVPARAAPSEAYPEIAPFREGYLRVSPQHEIHYELAGNPQGAPVMVLHGGPGGGSFPGLRRMHDPRRWLIVLHDQRGAGKSRPRGELRDNTTAALVEDVERLRQHLKLGPVHVFGGSWGSTLALAYAERHPRQVRSLLVRGIFTCTKAENDLFYHGGVALYFPEEYERFKALMPRPERLDYPRQLVEMMTGGDAAQRARAVRGWGMYAGRLGQLERTEAEVAAEVSGDENLANGALIENHYMAHGCFLEEGQLLRDAGKLAGIPMLIVHGRYDMMCPPQTAHRLHRAVPGSRLRMVEGAGHGGGAPRMRAALVAAVHELEAMLDSAR